MAKVTNLRVVALHNGQGLDFKGDENQEHPYAFPMVAISFAGGEWRTESDRVRYADDYRFRMHVYQELYADEHTGSTSQAAALVHLDFIDLVINALDDWTGALHVSRFSYRSELLDEDRTNVVEHVLEFSGSVIDDSLLAQIIAEQQTAVALDDEVIRTGLSQHESIKDFNEVVQFDDNPYRV